MADKKHNWTIIPEKGDQIKAKDQSVLEGHTKHLWRNFSKKWVIIGVVILFVLVLGVSKRSEFSESFLGEILQDIGLSDNKQFLGDLSFDQEEEDLSTLGDMFDNTNSESVVKNPENGALEAVFDEPSPTKLDSISKNPNKKVDDLFAKTETLDVEAVTEAESLTGLVPVDDMPVPDLTPVVDDSIPDVVTKTPVAEDVPTLPETDLDNISFPDELLDATADDNEIPFIPFEEEGVSLPIIPTNTETILDLSDTSVSDYVSNNTNLNEGSPFPINTHRVLTNPSNFHPTAPVNAYPIANVNQIAYRPNKMTSSGPELYLLLVFTVFVSGFLWKTLSKNK